jgi:uncharacterized Zn finger protein
MADDHYFGWPPYVSIAARRRQAMRALTKLQKTKKGHKASPVTIEGRKIATTFWGLAWCDNLERYSDFANRLPRGRSYVRSGSVLDLQIAPGEVKALVCGSEIYTVHVKVAVVPKTRWRAICHDCAGAIDSVIELLQGRLSKSVMARVCRDKTGLFPAPAELTFACSCPDYASMCKHVAAVLYGIGARLDQQPGLLFQLRNVNEQELVSKAGTALGTTKRPAGTKVLGGDLSKIFGIDIAPSEPPIKARAKPAARRAKSARPT